MNKKFAFSFLLFASLFGAFGNFQTTAQTKTGQTKNAAVEFWTKQRDKAFEKRTAPTGIAPKGLVVPQELKADGVAKQKTKLSEMVAAGYEQPLDFPDLAAKFLNGDLVELPVATESYFLDVGGSATEDEFSSFSFEDGTVILKPEAPKYLTLKKLADDFAGTTYDLNNPKDRRQMRIRLLRLVNPPTKALLEEIADAYQQKFKRPLRLTSMTRSMEYQLMLNNTNPETFRVTGKGSLPPHTSGGAFDIARKHLTAEEQNFILAKLAETERLGKTDSTIEYGVNACFHVFVYADGKPPKI